MLTRIRERRPEDRPAARRRGAVLDLPAAVACSPPPSSRRAPSPSGISFPADPQWHNFVDAWNVANITPLL